jgi:hypothetical protein
MKFRMPGATAIAAILVAVAAPAPLAFAQNGQAQAQVSRDVVQPLNEARAALTAKDWATSKTKLDAASAKAKTPVDKAQIERLRLYMASEMKDGNAQVASINMLMASGQLTPDEVKQYKGALAKAHLDAGNQPASLAAYRAFIDEYGGTPEQLISLANDYSKLNDHVASVTYANKAIDAHKAAGTKAPEPWFRLLANGYRAQKQMDQYYATREATLAAYPSSQYTEAYWRELIARAQEEPNFGRPATLDMYRALQATGVKLNPQEKAAASFEALEFRGLPGETVAWLEEGVASGEITSAREKENLATAKEQMKADKAGLAKETEDLLKKGDGSSLGKIGEAHLSYGDNAKAIEVLQAALTKGISDPNEAAIVRLHLGIAQYRAGQKDAARATWAEVKSDNGAGMLAKNWTIISNLKG